MATMRSTYIWFDGRLVPWDEAQVHVTAHALHYGSSVFEGIRAYATPKGPAVFCLWEHLERLAASCKIFRMDLPYSLEDLAKAIRETVRANGHAACYIRPLVFRGAGALGVDPRACPVHTVLITFEWGSYLGEGVLERGVDVAVSSWRRAAPDTGATMAKIGGQYVNSQFMVIEAKERGFAEAIALDAYGYLSEGSGENLFVVKDGVLYTPPLAAAILPGITRRCVLQLARDLGIPVQEQPLLREALYIADEVFFTGTAAEITPIRSVDRIPVGEGRPGPITKRLQEEFFGITSGRLEDRHGWLTPVNP
ncbi:MAG: branched-chain amino acid transaminase [Anaerolineae bacterium]